MKISAFRWVHSLKGWGWLTCVRFQDRGHPQIYAVLVRDGKILDGHYAVQTDACDTQTYVMFDAMRAARHSKPVVLEHIRKSGNRFSRIMLH